MCQAGNRYYAIFLDVGMFVGFINLFKFVTYYDFQT